MVLVFWPAVMVAPVGTAQVYPVAFAMAGTVYTFPADPAQTVVGPLTAPALAGRGVIVTSNGGEATPLPQMSFPETVMLPGNAVASKFTVMELVPAPLAMLYPAGRVHAYAVAPVTGAQE